MDISLGESGWNSETSTALPPRRSPPCISFLSGKWSSASWSAGTTTLVPTGQGTAFSDELLVVGLILPSLQQQLAPQSLGIIIKQLEIKVGGKITPFSPIWFLQRLSIKIVYTFIASLSIALESAVVSKHDALVSVPNNRDWDSKSLGYTCCQKLGLLRKLVPSSHGVQEKVVF